jgi:hypothetical protein
MALCTTGPAQKPKPNSQCGRSGCCSQAKTSRLCCFQASLPHPIGSPPLSHVSIHLPTIFLASVGLLLSGCGPACISEEQAKISDPSGLAFVITETNCDLVGNSTVTTIEAYGQGDSKTTLLKYGPDDRSGMPTIAVQGNRIVIEIDSVRDVSRQENHYKTYAIDYKIKHVEYPQK